MEKKMIFSNYLDYVLLKSNSDELLRYVGDYLVPEAGDAETNCTWEVIAHLKKNKMVCKDKNLGIAIKGEYNEQLYSFKLGKKNVLWNSNTDSFIIQASEKKLVVVNDNIQGLFMDTYRAIRQILISGLLNRGAIIIHSSGIMIKDKAYIFFGGKGAGKTTSVFQNVLKGKGIKKFLANERILALTVNNKILIYGWPGVAFVGVGTIISTVGLESLRDIHSRAGGVALLLTEHKLLTEEYLNGLIELGEKEASKKVEKVWLTPSEISTLTDCSIKNYGFLDKIFLPQLKIQERNTQRIRQITENELEELLDDSIITNINFYNDWLGLRKLNQDYIENNMLKDLLSIDAYMIEGSNLMIDGDES
ncbi:hypothetical protein HZI73_16795 [Vallitalea pronyensis]|uniref:Uncharacterized protein n=1 Tax=Vallitalea pronyensis TaxID=1348613 RepID=A0A8J8MLF3_9FIRM|nr:hypothetical protein [Vallitalea pronyensis]QUI23850.1 hypothetical protein HZI73_16795 [Vallitalea pronyensis]